MDPSIKSSTGSAPIIKQGHTADGRFGADPDAKVKGETKARDLSINAK